MQIFNTKTRLALLILLFIGFNALLVGFSAHSRTLIGHTQHANIKGLNDAQVMVQDKQGFLWFGNYTGLHRYNGYEIKSFTHNSNDENTLSANRITSLTIDTNNTLWVGTFKGLNRFNPQSHTFTRITSADNPQFNTMRVNGITMDTEGILWLATLESGVVKFNPKTNKLSQFTLPKVTSKTSEETTFWSIVQQKNGDIWLGSNVGLYQIRNSSNNQNANKQQPILVKHYTPKNSHLIDSFVVKMFVDKHDNLWIGTIKGLNYYHQKSGDLTSIGQLTNPPDELLSHSVSYLNLDNEDNLWVSTWGGGAHQITVNQQKLIRQQHGFNNTYTLKLNNLKHLRSVTTSPDINHIHTSFTDSFNTLWILSDQTIAKLPLDALKVGHIKYMPKYLQKNGNTAKPNNSHDDNVSLPSLTTLTMIEDKNGYQWYGSSQGLMRYHQKTRTARYFNYQKHNPNSLPNNNVKDIYQDSQQRIWIATLIGIVRYNPNSENFTRFLFDDIDVDKIEHNSLDFSTKIRDNTVTSINAITEDNNGILWLGTQNGIIEFNPNSGQFIRHAINRKHSLAIQDNLINTLHFDGKHTLWIAHLTSGLSTLNLKNMHFSAFSPSNSNSNSNDKTVSKLKEVNDIYQQGNIIWLATGTGLARISPDKKLTMYSDKTHGSIRYSSINKDNNNTLWIGTSKGMKSFNLNNNQFNHYVPSQGFHTDIYQKKTSFTAYDSKLYFSGNKGVEFFNPNDIKPIAPPKNIVIDNLLLANKEVTIDKQIINDIEFTLDRATEHITSITLSHQRNIFTLVFAAITTIEPQDILYAYRLKGFDDKWIQTKADNRRATFTNIPAGDYQFEVKAKRADSAWSDIKRLTVTMNPPWWKNNIAYVIYIILSFSAIWLGYRWRTASIIATSRALEQQVKERTATISTLMAQKDRMFANISHEFRTPLTLILNPTKNISSAATDHKLDEQHVIKSTTTIIRNAERLLRMVEQLIEFAKNESNGTQTGKQYYSVKATVDYLISCFDSVFSSKNLTVKVNDYQDVNVELKPDSLEIILTNLLSNAIKYTPPNGQIDIEITATNKQVTINITDTGIGIAAEHQTMVFERFGRVENTHPHTQNGSAGTGIGLALVKELVIANGGNISLTSTINQGSCFSVTFPISIPNNKSQQTSANANAQQYAQLEIKNLSHEPATIANDKEIDKEINKEINRELDNNKPLVLVIDDNQELLELIHNIISPHFNCLLAPNGAQGIEKAREQLPDLVISDLMMPGISGFEVLKTLKSDQLTAHIPVVMLTAKGDAQSRIEGWNNQADEYLAKPFSDKELIARINNILAIRQLISQRFQQQFAKSAKQQNNSPVCETSSNHNSSNESQTESLDKFANQFSQKLETILQTHYQDEKLNVATIASEMAMSQRQLIRKTKSILAMTPNESIRAYRLQKAATLLIEGQAPSTIAYEVGFASHSYFAACFKAQFNCTPTDYAKPKNAH